MILFPSFVCRHASGRDDVTGLSLQGLIAALAKVRFKLLCMCLNRTPLYLSSLIVFIGRARCI